MAAFKEKLSEDSAIRETKQTYYGSLIQNAPNKSKAVWTVINNVQCRKQATPIMPNFDGNPVNIANEFDRFLADTVTNLREPLPKQDYDPIKLKRNPK
ncbi:hypothetical protein HHI36_013361 [Cryptolaemus montrouzieri]|uniref:Uncharacterized protein n=1 Tax=Cryptolaemus montrouzieri TaxID=559131 RepID=A0ABD2NHH5_9CUCU